MVEIQNKREYQMKNSEDMPINQFQLNALLSKEEKEFYNYVIESNVFCTGCGKTCEQGITVNSLLLTSTNDLVVQGICNVCQGKVARVMEFGENKEFYKKAMNFRNTVKI